MSPSAVWRVPLSSVVAPGIGCSLSCFREIRGASRIVFPQQNVAGSCRKTRRNLLLSCQHIERGTQYPWRFVVHKVKAKIQKPKHEADTAARAGSTGRPSAHRAGHRRTARTAKTFRPLVRGPRRASAGLSIQKMTFKIFAPKAFRISECLSVTVWNA